MTTTLLHDTRRGARPEFIRLNPRVIEMVRHFSKLESPSPPSCHAPQLLAAAGVLQGKKCSAYPRPALTSLSPEAIMSAGPMTEAVVDGNLVTGPAGPRSIPARQIPHPPRLQESSPDHSPLRISSPAVLVPNCYITFLGIPVCESPLKPVNSL